MPEHDLAPECNSFFDHAGVEMEVIPDGPGVPLGLQVVRSIELGIGGVYGTWGKAYDNSALPQLVTERLGRPLADNERLNLAELGFVDRHHVPILPRDECIEVEVCAGARFLSEAAQANGWQPSEVEAVLIGSSAPITEDYTQRIADKAGIPDDALKVSIHKACDGSVAGLNLALNPGLPALGRQAQNLAEALLGKKVLVGGIEGLSRFLYHSHDTQALQLFGTGAGVIGLIPGRTMRFLAGITDEIFDQEGLLQVAMSYPHSRAAAAGQSRIEVTQLSEHHFRVAGMQHEPDQTGEPVVMAGPMGMVKLFVRSGVAAVRSVYQVYRQRMGEIGMPDKDIAVVIAHHANLKINQLKAKHLEREGIHLSIPWLLSEFGNVSAASNMIAFLRQLPDLSQGDHVLFDGFGAGTYYDVLAVEV
jgi:3-oxoacyl-[acyl-carrier-protein] synthase III